MDYKYIKQLLERYWQCETSLEEESILKMFFSQDEIPAELMPYKGLFASEKTLQEAHLNESFDAKVLNEVEKGQPVKARKLSLTRRLMPFYKAAACVAIILTLGNAAQNSFRQQETGDDYNYETYQDSYNDPEMAYDQISDALQMVSQSLNEVSSLDSLQQKPEEGAQN